MTRRPDPADAVNAAVRARGFTPLADIVEALTCARENLGWSQAEAAERIGVSQSRLASWETSNLARRVTPGADSLLKWAHGVGVDLAPILPGALSAAYSQGFSDCADAMAAYVANILGGVTDARTDSPDSNEGART